MAYSSPTCDDDSPLFVFVACAYGRDSSEAVPLLLRCLRVVVPALHVPQHLDEFPEGRYQGAEKAPAADLGASPRSNDSNGFWPLQGLSLRMRGFGGTIAPVLTRHAQGDVSLAFKSFPPFS